MMMIKTKKYDLLSIIEANTIKSNGVSSESQRQKHLKITTVMYELTN